MPGFVSDMPGVKGETRSVMTEECESYAGGKKERGGGSISAG